MNKNNDTINWIIFGIGNGLVMQSANQQHMAIAFLFCVLTYVHVSVNMVQPLKHQLQQVQENKQ